MISIQFADPDGFLYFTYSSQESFGWRQKWTNQSYVTIWMFVYFSKHGQIYVCNNLEGFSCKPIYFRKQSFNKRKFSCKGKFPALSRVGNAESFGQRELSWVLGMIS